MISGASQRFLTLVKCFSFAWDMAIKTLKVDAILSNKLCHLLPFPYSAIVH